MAKKQTNEVRFMKSDLLKSKQFINQIDLVSAVLEDGAEYTIEEAKNKIDEYLKGKVN